LRAGGWGQQYTSPHDPGDEAKHVTNQDHYTQFKQAENSADSTFAGDTRATAQSLAGSYIASIWIGILVSDDVSPCRAVARTS
jgi:hypothetical protein